MSDTPFATDVGFPQGEADPHADVHELMARLVSAAEDDQWVDAFLLGAGAVQVVEDRSQGTSWSARRLVRHLDGQVRGRLPGIGLRSAGRCLDASTEVFLAVPPVRRLRAWSGLMSGLTETLAGLVLDTGAPAQAGEGVREGLRRAAGLLVRDSGVERLLRGALLRPPTCFCSFDQHPQDIAELARRFADEHPGRGRPLLVVGVRTSGSYLAPLAGAALRQLGYRHVLVGTTRPGAALLSGDSELVDRTRRAGGLILVVDDPPMTGGSLAAVAARAEREGFPAAAVVPLFASFEDRGTAPAALERYPCVVLPGADWEVHRRLRAPALGRIVPGLLPPGHRLTLLEVGEPGRLARGRHLSVPLTAHVEGPSGDSRSLPLLAEWSGVGYLGRRAVTLAAALAGLVPEVHGFADGVLLRELLPGEDGAAVAGESVGPAEVARYVAARQERLAVPEDRSRWLRGREPVWEMAARVLAPALGRLDVALRPALLYPLTKSLLTAERPCLVDGRTAPQHWVLDAAGGWLKTDYAEGAFSHRNLASYDAAYDLAGAAACGTGADTGGDGGGVLDGAVDGAADGSADGIADELLDEYRHLTGRRISAAPWCLYQVVQAGQLTPGATVRRTRARAVQRFLAGAYLADLDGEPRGPWCVLDVDGVLESDVMGFSASSPQGMLALRALRAHGYRTLIATGRSLPEVRDRCVSYRLAGGVAEYGAVCYDTEAGASHVALPSARRQADDGGLRQRLSGLADVGVDPLSRWCVRASVRNGAARTGLPERTVTELLEEPAFGRLFEVVPGEAQTDFVPRGTDKVSGVRALLERLGNAAAVPLLAVGDGVADVRLLQWASRGAAPGNAAPEVRAAGVPVSRHSYQAGLADSVGQLIGHRPGGCPVCRPPEHPADTRALLALLAVPEAGRAGAPARLARLAAEVLALRGSAGPLPSKPPDGTGPPGREEAEPS